MTFTCTKCKETQPLENFHTRSCLKRGHTSTCKVCNRKSRADYFIRNKEKESSRSRVRAWKAMGLDLSMSKYQEMVLKVNNQCEICQTSLETLAVDHCHTTGKIRGLLCGSCNRALGLFKESASNLNAAIQYLNTNNV